MTLPDPVSTYHEQIRRFFAQATKKARDTKFVQRESPLTGSLFLQAMILTILRSGVITLDDLAQAAHQLDPEVEVTGQAFKQRFTLFAVAFFKQMFVEALCLTGAVSASAMPLLEAFSEVNLLDSSTITLPDALKEEFPGCGGGGARAAAKVYLLLNYLTGAYTEMRIESGRKADQNMGTRFLAGHAANSLWIFDLGFFDAVFLAQIAAAASFFVCRLAASQTVFHHRRADGGLEPFDLDRFLARAPRQLLELEVIFGPKKEVTTRLILVPVPVEVAAQRRRKTREKARQNGRQPTQKTLNRSDWTLLLTNAGEQQLPTSTVPEVYRVRWQIELAFKLFKSDAKLETTKASEKYRVQCEFYAKLITLLLFNRICGVTEKVTGERLSQTKLWRRLQKESKDLRLLLGQGTGRALRKILKFVSLYAKPCKGRKHPSTPERVERAARDARQVSLSSPPWDQEDAKAPPPETFTGAGKSRKTGINSKQSGNQGKALVS